MSWNGCVAAKEEPRNRVNEAHCSARDRLLSLRTRKRSAAYKGVYSLILREGARDWMDERNEMAVFD